MENYPEVIQKEIKEKNNEIEKIVSWVKDCKIAEEIMSQIGWEKGWDKKYQISCGIGNGILNGILIHIHDVVNHDEEVIPIVDKFLSKGYKVENVSDYAGIQRRTWDLGNIKVNAFYDQKANGCRFVESGEKIVKTYKFVCPDSEKV